MGIFDKGTNKTNRGFFGRLSRAIVGKTRIDDGILDAMEEALVETDMGVDTTLKLIDALAYLYKKDTLYGNDESINREIYKMFSQHFAYLPDLLRTQQIKELTGFSTTAIQRWVLEKRIIAIHGRKGWNIPRESLIAFLSSSYCLRGNRKPQKFQAILEKCAGELKP